MGSRGEGEGAPVSAEEDGSRADMEEDDGVARAEVVMDSPADGVGALIGEVYSDVDLAASSSSRGTSGMVVVTWRRGVMDLHSSKLGVVGIKWVSIITVVLRIHVFFLGFYFLFRL